MEESIKKLIDENPTAFYTFDITELKRRIAYLKSKLPSIELCYAVKANTFIIKEAEPMVERLEVCSPGEEKVCRTLGVPSEKTVISGVYKTPNFIEALVADKNFNGLFTAESAAQYELLCTLSEKYNRKLRVMPRLTNGSQFGMNKADIIKIIAERDRHESIDIVGIQYFSGTQKTSAKKISRELAKLDEFLLRLRDELGYTASELEYGAGFPVAYFEGEELDEESLFDGFCSAVATMTCKPKITVELGRSVAASCGKYYTHVVDKKTNKSQNYLLVDGGMHHLVYFGQQMAMKKPFLSLVGKEALPPTAEWHICGSLCSMNDIIAKQVCLPDVQIGDVIAFENTGAYCMTEGISLFLTRDIPPIYLIKENGDVINVRRRFETSALNTPEY